eukprot:1026602_1
MSVHPVSPFHARKINDPVIISEYKKSNELDDASNIHQWYDQLKTKMLPTLMIPLTRKEINALKIYTTYWSIYKTHIVQNYDQMKEDPSLWDKLPNNLSSVIEMHYKNIQTPAQDDTKWGEQFNYSMIDGMQKYVDSWKCLQHKISEALSTIRHKQNECVYIVPKLSTNLSLPFDSTYESMKIFNILNDIPNPQTDNGCDILRIFHEAIWTSLQHNSNNDTTTHHTLDLLCRSGFTMPTITVALLQFTSEEEQQQEDDSKQKDNEKLSIVLQLYCVPNDLQHSECIMDRFLEFRMFLGKDNAPTAITQMQTFLNIISQDRVNKASKSFLIPLKNSTLGLWNAVLSLDEQKTTETECLEQFQENVKRILLNEYEKIKENITLTGVTNCCVDFVLIRMNRGFDVRLIGICRLPVYPHDYGMYIWNEDKQQILDGNAEKQWNVMVRKDDGCLMDFDETNDVLSANVYSCVMDYFVQKKWIENTMANRGNNAANNRLKVCCIL